MQQFPTEGFHLVATIALHGLWRQNSLNLVLYLHRIMREAEDAAELSREVHGKEHTI